MAFSFVPVHIPGKKHVVPDTLSRRLDSPITHLEKLPSLPPVTNNVLPQYADSFGPPSWVASPTVASMTYEQDVEDLYLGQVMSTLAALASTNPSAGQSLITWDILQEECLTCPYYTKLHSAVENNDIQEIKQETSGYSNVFHELTTMGPVVMLNNRVVVPNKLRNAVLAHLHSSHAGVGSMLARALRSVYWPGYKRDIEDTRNSCKSCHEYALSNKALPMIAKPDMPSYPFQMLCSDVMEWLGHNYLIIVDKYSNWLSILKLGKSDSKHLIQALRTYFSTFGVAEVICTDGATMYTSSEFKDFCKLWGIHHRISTAYNPAANKRAEVGVKSANA